jgi:hypothetical protein
MLAPDGLAVTNAGIVYFATTDIGGTGTPAFHKLDTTNATIVDLGPFQSGGIADDFDRVALSPDGTKVYSNIEGGSFWLDTSNDQIHGSNGTSSNDGGIPDLWVSGDGSTVCIDGYLADSLLNAETQAAYIDWETWFPEGVTGQKVNQDGSILFQPLTDGIDLIARNTGRLLYRVQIPMSPADVYDPMLVADGENALGIITSTGVSFVDLSSLPIAAEFTQPFAEATHSPAGSTVRRQSFPQMLPSPTGQRVSSRPRPSLRRRTPGRDGSVVSSTFPAPRVAGVLQSDDAFRSAYDFRLDELLAEKKILIRQPDGFLMPPPDPVDPTLWMIAHEALHRQLAEDGFVDRAVSVLQRAGYHAWKNPVGHIAVEPIAPSPFISTTAMAD